jgi:phosphatidylserine decarboxylase
LRIPVAPEGWPFIVPPAAAACILAAMGWWAAGTVFAVAAAAFLGFFRDPERTMPGMPGALVAPADGKVMAIALVDDHWVGAAVRVSIFLSPLDVHVNRIPVSGRLARVDYHPGQFLPAYRDEAGTRNERNELWIDHGGEMVVCRQITGVLVRRVVCRLEAGAEVHAGERFGIMKFGSRIDLFLPPRAVLRVKPDDRVRGGETILTAL